MAKHLNLIVLENIDSSLMPTDFTWKTHSDSLCIQSKF